MTRPLNSKFTVSSERPAFVYYNFKVDLTLLLSSAAIQLCIYDLSDNETIVAEASYAYLLGLGSPYPQLSAHVPIGYQVQLKKTGNGTVNVIREQEVIC